MKRGHGHEGGGGGYTRDVDDSAKRQRLRYDYRPSLDSCDKPQRQASPSRGGNRGDRPSLTPPPPRPPSTAGASPCPQVQLLSEQKETDPHRLAQRQKQIDYGKNTLGYDRYCAQVPRHKRRHKDPVTPDKTALVGKKVFDRMVSQWRQALHKFDPPELAKQQEQHKRAGSRPSGGDKQPSIADRATSSTEPLAASAGDPDAVEADKTGGVATKTEPAASSRSIFDNFDEADGEADDDDDDDDLL